VVVRLNESEEPVGIILLSFFRFAFYVMGMARFLFALYDEPDLMHDVLSFWGSYLADVLRRATGSLRLDYVLFLEDLAGKNGPLISPDTYDAFWRPHLEPVFEVLRDYEVPVICEWSSGRLDVLLPTMLDQGFTCTWPLEVAAGMDAVGLRQRYGQKLLLAGNIAKEAVIAGPEAIDREIERLLPLIREGGFLPGLDDMASPDMPFAHYRYLIEKLYSIELG
jgi:uroporphyrinogen decarboxylase